MGKRPPKSRNSETVIVRVRLDVREALERLANQSGLSMSRHVQRALDQYIERSKRAPHVDEFADRVAFLVEKIERWTERKWTEDSFTAEVTREALAQLFRAFVSGDTKIEEFIPPKLAKEFATAKRQITPKIVGRRAAADLLREAMTSTKPEEVK